MIFKGTAKGPDREYYLSDGGKLWIPAARGPGMFRPSWGDLLKLGYMKLFGIEVVAAPPAIAGGSGFSGGGGGGGGANTDRFVINHPGKIGSTGANPAASATYFSIPGNYFPGAILGSNPNVQVPMAVAGTLTAMYLHVRIGVNTTGTTGLTVTHCIRRNDTTDSSPVVTIEYTTTASASVSATANATGLSLAFAAGDFFTQKIVTPAWTSTPPTGVFYDASLLFTLA